MPAALWRTLLLAEIAFAIIVSLAITALTDLDAWLALPIALGTLLLIQYLLVAVSLVLSRALAGADRGGRTILSTLQAALSEPVHFALAQLAMIAEPLLPEPQATRASEDRRAQPVLLVHGLACNRGVWRWLLSRLRAAGFTCVHSVNLQPMRADIDRLTVCLEQEVLRIHRSFAGCRVTIIAHSMGGLAARALLRSIGPEVIRHVITVATPHHGAALARMLVNWPSAKQLCIGSSWLNALNASQAGGAAVALTSVYSLDDNLVWPGSSARLHGAQMREMRGLGHFGLLVSRRALDGVMSALEGPV